MNTEQVIADLNGDRHHIEAYVLVREIRLCLDIEHCSFHPYVRIKIWKSDLIPDTPYHFTLSHEIHIPNEGAYHPSGTLADSESLAIFLAINAIIYSFDQGVSKGMHPDETWMKPCPDF